MENGESIVGNTGENPEQHVSENAAESGFGNPGEDAGAGAANVDGGAQPIAAGSGLVAGSDAARRRVIGLVLDFVVGLCALMMAGIFVAILHRAAMPILVVAACAVFFAVAAIKAIWSQLNPWVEGLAISLGAFFPIGVLAIAVGHAGRFEVWGFALLLVVTCGAGAQAQKLWRAQPLAGVAIAAALLGVVFVGLRLAAPLLMSMGQRTMNEPAPRFTVTMLDGTPVSLDSLKGRVVVLDFWGTWCEPCMAEMPAIVKVHRRYQSNGDVVFLAVNAGWHGDTDNLVRSFVSRRHLDVPVALDSGATVKSLKVDALPTLVLIDRQGHIRMEEAGYSPDEPLESELTGEIAGLLGKP